MEAMILDRSFASQALIDAFESFIWTDRYDTPGDFEIYMPIAKAPLEFIKRDYYIWIRDSDRLQIIEDITIETDAEDGDHIKFTGRTLESLLERRVVYFPTEINGNLQDGIELLLNENAIKPTDSRRRLPGLRFIRNEDSRVKNLIMIGSFFGESLLDIVETYCQLYGLGFKITFNEEESTFDFSLYYGEDRSYDQDTLPWVVFSSEYGNLFGSNYFESYTNLRTAAVIASDDDEEYGQEIVDVDTHSSMTGLDRREAFVEGSSIRWEVEEPEEPNPSDYEDPDKYRKDYEAYLLKREQAIETARENLRAELTQTAELALAETYITRSFEGEIEAIRQFVYGVDFFIGDIVQVRNQYGKEASSRITEVVRSHDVSGYKLTPTFTTLIGGDNEGDVELEE